jgi:hypothetical protein
LVVDAVVANRFVEVAFVVVLKVEVSEVIVEDAVSRTPIVVVGARYVLPAEPRTFQSLLFNQ